MYRVTHHNGVTHSGAPSNRLLTAMDLTAFDAILALDEAHRYLASVDIGSATSVPSGQWNSLLAQLSPKAVLVESAQADSAEDAQERTDQITSDLFTTAAVFLTAEANNLEDRIESLPDEHQQKGIFFRSSDVKVTLDKELTPVRLSDVVDEVSHTASTLINWTEQGTWQQYTDRVAFARRWADEIVDSVSYTALEHEELVRRMLGFVHQLVEATLSAEPNSTVGHQIGTKIAMMVIGCFTDVIPPVLHKTRPLIIEGLPRLLGETSQDLDVTKRVQHLTNNIATAYDQALKGPSLDTQHKHAPWSYIPRSLMAAALILVAAIGTLSVANVLHSNDNLAKTEFVPIVSAKMIPSPNSDTCNFSLFISAYGSGAVDYLVSLRGGSDPSKSGTIKFTGGKDQMSGQSVKIPNITPGDGLSAKVVVQNYPDKHYSVSCERKIQG
jgi:hypothetical protein